MPLESEDILKELQSWREDMSSWREEAYEAYGIAAGDQWDQEDRSRLTDAERPSVTFNRTAALIRGISGLESGNRQEVRYLPREVGDARVSEILTHAARWVRDECNAAEEESEAFRDLLVCGMGFVETWVDTESNPDGDIRIDRRDPLSCGWDPSAKKRGLQDAGWIATWKRVRLSEIQKRWPGKVDNAEWMDLALDLEESHEPHNDALSPWYESGASGKGPDDRPRVVQYQYFKEVPAVRVFLPGGRKMDLPRERFKQVAEIFAQQGVPHRDITIREYRQRIQVGRVELEDEAIPSDWFSIIPMTGVRDRNESLWYGLIRDTKDPQKWSNKFFSLILDIVANNAKGGLLAESGSFVNDRQAEEDWADPRKIVWTQPGAIQSARVKERTSQAVPPALSQMLQYANEIMPQVSGISLEFLGLADRMQAGVLEHQRKQATINTLGVFFDSLKLYRKMQGRVVVPFMREYLNDGRLIRIQEGAHQQFVPLALDKETMEYDVVVDESPLSQDVKGRTWAVLETILPTLLKMGAPIPPTVVDYMPIPSSLAAEWKQMLSQAMQGAQIPPEMKAQAQAMHAQIQKLSQENQALKSKREEKMAELQADMQAKILELQAEGQSEMARLKLKEEIAAAEMEMRRQQIMLENELKREELGLKQAEKVVDLDFKRQEMGIKASDMQAQRAERQAQMEIDRAYRESERQERTRQTQEAAPEAPVGKSVELKRDKSGKITGATVKMTDGSTRTAKVRRKGGQISGATFTEG